MTRIVYAHMNKARTHVLYLHGGIGASKNVYNGRVLNLITGTCFLDTENCFVFVLFRFKFGGANIVRRQYRYRENTFSMFPSGKKQKLKVTFSRFLFGRYNKVIKGRGAVVTNNKIKIVKRIVNIFVY